MTIPRNNFRNAPFSLMFGFLSSILIFLVIHITTLYHGHNWGGDFSQYIIHARNLVAGQPYTDNIALEIWVVSPPGFPFILVPLIYAFGINFKILKLVNICFWMLYALVLGKLAQPRLGGKLAFGVTLVILSSPYFFWFKQNILSDIPFLFFVTAGLWTATRYFEGEDNPHQKRLWFCLSLCLMLWAQLTRLAGATLFAAMVVYIGLTHKDKKLLMPLSGTWLLALIVLLHFGISPGQHFKEIDLGFLEWLKISCLRCADAVKYIIAFYLSPAMKTPFTAPLFPVLEKTFDILNPFILLGMIAVYGHKAKERSVSFIGVFFFVYFFSWAGWSLSGGERYGLPVYGLALIFVLEYLSKACVSLLKMRLLTERIMQGLLIVLICHNCFSIYSHYDFNDDYIYKRTTREMLAWVKNNTGPDERIMFYKPRILSLLTQRRVATNWNFWEHPRENKEGWLKRIVRLKIDYLIKAKGLNDYWFLSQPDMFSRIRLRPVWENDEYVVFKILNVNVSSP